MKGREGVVGIAHLNATLITHCAGFLSHATNSILQVLWRGTSGDRGGERMLHLWRGTSGDRGGERMLLEASSHHFTENIHLAAWNVCMLQDNLNNLERHTAIGAQELLCYKIAITALGET